MRMPSSAILTLFAAIGVAAPVPADKEKVKTKDEESIVGTWQLTDMDVGGGKKAGVPDDWKKIEYTFNKDGTFAMVQSGRPALEGTFKLTPTASPKAIDIVRKDGTFQSAGLYQLDKDVLVLCVIQKPNAERPKELKGDAEKFTIVFTLSRVREEKK